MTRSAWPASSSETASWPPTASTAPTWSCSTPAASVRTPTTSCTATSGTSRPSRIAGPISRSRWAAAWPKRTGPPSSSAPPGWTPSGAPTTWATPAIFSPPPVRPATPVLEILDAPGSSPGDEEAFPSALAGPPGAGLGGLGHHPDRLRQQLRLLHRARRARPRGQPAVRADSGGGRAAGRGGHRRGHPARPERQLLWPGPHHPAADRAGLAPARRCDRGRPGPAIEPPRARPLFADLLQAVARVDGIRRVRFTSPHPKDLRPETIEVMASEPAVCPQLHLPLQAGSDRILARMHRGYTAARYLERLGRGPGRDRRPGGHHRHHRGLPGRDRSRTSSGPWKSPPKRPTTAPTPSSTRPGRAPRRPTGTRR